MRSFKLLLFFFLFVNPAIAQQTVITKPFVTTQNINASSTITTTDVFQTVLAESATRSSCTIQNNGNNPMWVYFGARTSATKDASVKLAIGQSVSCLVGSIVLKFEVSITGTIGEVFYAAGQ